MSQIIRKRLCIEDLLQGDQVCKNPTFQWENTSDCVSVPCEEENCIEVEVTADCDDPCINVIIDCEDCEQCPPQRFNVCFCDDHDDCTICETCESNICVDKCDELCDSQTGDCVECLAYEDCPCNQICVSGECQCPVDKPLVDERDCCKECLEDNDCDDCYVCEGDSCVPLDCPDGTFCDPETTTCEECVDDGDCTGGNECCSSDNECVCCSGYFRNPSTGNCEPEPDCRRKEDCPECKICDDGDCVDMTCPAGTTCIGDECRRLCDCDDRHCPEGYTCVNKDDTTCYCYECTGNCDDNSDCTDPCYCGNGGECEPNPCYGNCSSGSDCGPGCGCDDGGCVPCTSLDCDGTCEEVDGCHCDGDDCKASPCSGYCENSGDCGEGCGCYDNQCVSCDSVDCDTCQHVAGCECLDGTNCAESPCSGPCANGEDCGAGCGCSNYECVSCSQHSCANNADCPEGCICGDNGQCKDNPCASDTCENGDDCGEGCGCDENGNCVPCSSLDCPDDCDLIDGCECVGGNCQEGGDDDCDDELTIELDHDQCDLIGRLEVNDCCSCPDIGLGLISDNYTSVDSETYHIDFKAQLRKGSFANLQQFLNNDRLSNTGIDNELPSSGEIEVTVTTKVASTVDPNPPDEDEPPYQTLNAPYDLTVSKTLNFQDSDQEIAQFTDLYKPGNLVSIDGVQHEVLSVRVTVKVTADFQFPNECVYATGNKTVVFWDDDTQLADDKGNAWELSTETNCRDPLFTWYKAPSAVSLRTAGNIFRQFYASNTGGNVYEDILEDHDTDELDPFRYYALESDCGCDTVTKYSCFGDEDNPTELVFCDPDVFPNYEITNCGRTIEFDSDLKVNCDVYEESDVKPVYEIYVNGTQHGGSITLPSSGVIWSASNPITKSEPITSISLKIQGDECEQCTITENIDAYDEMTIGAYFEEGECANQSTVTLNITATGGNSPYEYQVTDPDAGNYTGTFGSSTTTQVDPIDGSYTVEVTDDDGCVKQITVQYDATESDVNQLLNIDVDCQVPEITFENNSTMGATGYIAGQGTFQVGAGQTMVRAISYGSYDAEFWLKGNEDCKLTETGTCQAERGSIDATASAQCDDSGNLDIRVTNNSGFAIDAEVKNASDSTVASATVAAGTSYTFEGEDEGLNPNNEYSVVVSPSDGTGELTILDWKGQGCCQDFYGDISIEYTCDSDQAYLIIENPNSYSISYQIDQGPQVDIGNNGIDKTDNVTLVDGTRTIKVINNADTNCVLEKDLQVNCCEGCTYSGFAGMYVKKLYDSSGALIWENTGLTQSLSQIESSIESALVSKGDCITPNVKITQIGSYDHRIEITTSLDFEQGYIIDDYDGGSHINLKTHIGACSCDPALDECQYEFSNFTERASFVAGFTIGSKVKTYSQALNVGDPSDRSQLKQDITAAIANQATAGCSAQYGMTDTTAVTITATSITIAGTHTAIGTIKIGDAAAGYGTADRYSWTDQGCSQGLV